MKTKLPMGAVLGVVFVVLFLGTLVIYWLHTHTRIESVMPMPRTGEAARNPLYALKLALEKDDVRVNARRRLQLLPGNEPVVPLAVRDTLVLYNDPRTLTAKERDTLLTWVEHGGHLIVRTPPFGMFGKNGPAPLLDELELMPLPDREFACADLRGDGRRPTLDKFGEGGAIDADDLDDLDDDNAEEADAKPKFGSRMFCGSRRFTLAGANPQQSWGDLNEGYVFARVRRGEGSVDVLADLQFLSTDQLDEGWNAEFARQLLAPNYRAGTVHLVYAAQVPSLWLTLLHRSWMAWGPLALAMLFWLWRRTQRFGPQLATPASERRSLLEHIAAAGEHAYRYGYAHLLYAAVRNAFLARLRRRDPQAAALEGEPQLALLRERFADVPASDIRDALMTPFANDHAAFRSRIATLIRLRNRL